jgi:hypothetical protein
MSVQLSLSFEDLVHLAEQLTPEEQKTLIERLETGKKKPVPFDFPVIDIGPWPGDFSLRREDWYSDDGR